MTLEELQDSLKEEGGSEEYEEDQEWGDDYAEALSLLNECYDLLDDLADPKVVGISRRNRSRIRQAAKELADYLLNHNQDDQDQEEQE